MRALVLGRQIAHALGFRAIRAKSLSGGAKVGRIRALCRAVDQVRRSTRRCEFRRVMVCIRDAALAIALASNHNDDVVVERFLAGVCRRIFVRDEGGSPAGVVDARGGCWKRVKERKKKNNERNNRWSASARHSKSL